MSDRHFAHWPRHLPRHMAIPQTHLFYNVEVSAARYPLKPYIIFYDNLISFAQFKREAEYVAGFLQGQCGVRKGDRVVLFMQNSPQFVLAYYGILRADAVVVPVNSMNLTQELAYTIRDSGATTALVAQELYPQIAPLIAANATESDRSGPDQTEQARLQHVIVATYSDYLTTPTDLAVPEIFAAPRQPIAAAGVTAWSAMLAQQLQPGPMTATSDDLSTLVYTSGTTGHPKGCMHTHRSVMHTLVAGVQWFGVFANSVYLAVAPFFHVTGMQGSMNGPLYSGSTIVLLPRWDREVAAQCIERYRVDAWSALPAIFIDFLSNPKLGNYDISSLARISGGGAAMPEAIAQRMLDRGITYFEGYGLTETMAPSHINPPQRPKKQCLGIPIFDTESRVVDTEHFHELAPGAVGEIVTRGPQVFSGYWNNPQATREAFVEIDGKSFLRTGDLGATDEEGYFFMVDRLKRMINAAGYKVWPAEVETMMYAHPAIQDACVISAGDAHRGETVKALIVLKQESRGTVSEADIIAWAKHAMAAYKYPRIVEFVDSLPRSAVGKVQWRALQELENAKNPP